MTNGAKTSATLNPQPEPGQAFPADVWELIRGWPEGVAVSAAERGCTVGQVYDAYECACWDFSCHAREVFGVRIPEPFDPIDWPYMIEEHGFTVDLAALEADRNAFHGFSDTPIIEVGA